MGQFGMKLAIACLTLVSAQSVIAQVYDETFPDPLGTWTARWFYLNSNAENYYVAGNYSCSEDYRGSNPCSLWIADTQGCNSGVGGPTCDIVFHPSFGMQMQSFAFDLCSFTSLDLKVYDMSNNVILNVTNADQTHDFCAGTRYTATSSNGISHILMDTTAYGGAPVEGNVAWDNLEAILGSGGGYHLTLGGTCPGTVSVSWSGAAHNAQQAIIFGNNMGSTVIPPGNPCAGTTLGVAGSVMQIGGYIPTGSGGSGTVNGSAGGFACNHYLQLVTGGSCATSNVAQIP